MSSGVNGQFFGLSALWSSLLGYKNIWYHITTSYGCKIVHVLDRDGYEIALLNNATCRWEMRRYSPQRWFPLPADAIEIEFEGDKLIDCFNLDRFDTTFPGGYK